MGHYELNILDYWLIVKKRKYLILLTAVLVLCLSLALSYFLLAAPIYEASARAKFERSTTMTDIFLQSVTYYGYNDLQTQPEVIKSYTVIEEVAKSLGVVPGNASEEVQKSKEYVSKVISLRDRVSAESEPDSAILNIVAQAPDPDQAAQLANAVATAYREENIRARNRTVMESLIFIESQLAELEKKLGKAEDELRQFKEQEGQVFLNEEAKMALRSFTSLELDYNRITRMKEETANQVKILRERGRSHSNAGRIFDQTANSVVSSLNTRLVDLLQNRTTLLIAYTPDHPKVQLVERKIRNVKLEMLKALVSKLKSLSSQEEVLQGQIDQYRERYLNFPRSAIQLTRLEREVNVSAELLAKLKVKHQEILIKSAERIEEVTLITPAVPSDMPINAQSMHMNALVGALMGVFLGVALAFTRESFDTSIGTIEGVEEFLKVPVLGVIPQFNDKHMRESAAKVLPAKTASSVIEMFSRLPCLVDPKSVLSENLRSLRTNLHFAKTDRDIKSMVFTSAGLGEGKSTTVINLAVAMAQDGQKVLLVDADLRVPIIHKRLGLRREPGLTEALTGARGWKNSVQGVSDIMLGELGVDQVMNLPGLDNLHVLPSGANPGNPGEIINLDKVSKLIQDMQQHYDMVLIDTPPILPVTDAVTISSCADGTILVYQVGRIGRSALRRVKFLLEHAQSNVMGVVLTNVRAEVAPEYGYLDYVYR